MYYAYTSFYSLTLDACVFSGNVAFEGGGVYSLESGPTLTNCTFSNNWGTDFGGGICSFGGSPAVANGVFSANSAPQGGGMYNRENSPVVINCTFIGNSSVTGAGLFNDAASPTVANCILRDAAASEIHDEGSAASVVTYSCLRGWYAGEGNIDANPRFVDANGADNIPGTADDDLRLLLVSPCIDVGDNEAVPPGVITDHAGGPRFVDAPQTPNTGAGTPPLVDMGAYEFQPPLLGDLDTDGDVDLYDFLLLQQQFTGPLP